MVDESSFAASLELERVDEGTFVCQPLAGAAAGFVVAGLVSAQMLQAASAGVPDVPPRSINTVYTSLIRSDEPYEIGVHALHVGRQLSAVSISATQRGRTCASALVSLGPTVTDLIRHSLSAPEVGLPEAAAKTTQFANLVGEARVVGGIDLSRSDQSFPPTFAVWRRAPGLAPKMHQAVVVHDANSFLPGTALLPHSGLSLADAHRTISTVITASEVVFHQVTDLRTWMLFENRSTFAGNGWAYGTGTVHSEAAELLSSYTQQSIIRTLRAQGHR